jgi:hypothetical protein
VEKDKEYKMDYYEMHYTILVAYSKAHIDGGGRKNTSSISVTLPRASNSSSNPELEIKIFLRGQR